MATRYVVQTFIDIINAVREELGADQNDTKVLNRIKRDINEVYLQEICAEKTAWWWLTKNVEVQAKAYFNTGTAAVTVNSTTVTLTETPSVSYRGYLFSADGYNEIYRIARHTSGSTTLYLESPYTGSTSSATDFRIWADSVPLPADCSNTLEVRHSFKSKPLEGLGIQEFRRLVSTAPKASQRPEFYCTGNLVDPDPYESISGLPATTYRSSSGLVRTVVFASTLGASEATAYLAPGDRIEVTGAGHQDYNGTWVVSELSTTTATNDTVKFTAESNKTESSTSDTGITIKKIASTDKKAKYRELLLYPSLFDANTTLYVDYKMEAPPLIDDSDEPLIPLEDRNVLVYGALSRQWVKVRDEETANRNEIKFQQKLAKMAGRIDDAIDLPKIQISGNYLRGKRRASRGHRISAPESLGFAIGGGASAVTGTANRIAIFNSDGRLVSDSTITPTDLSDLIQDYEELTTATLVDNTSSATTITSWTAATYDSVILQYSLKRGSANKEVGVLKIATDGSSTALSQSDIATLGTLGVTFTADVSSGSLRLRYTTTSTGTDVTMKYRAYRWLA